MVEKKSNIFERWLNLMLESYPAESQNFLKKKKNRFDNPMAYDFHQGAEGIYELLLHGVDSDKAFPLLDKIIRIKAVQGISPSGAISFIFLLKKVIREELKMEILEEHIYEEILEFESRIDRLALISFDVYMNRKEKLYELRVKEVKNRVSGLLRMAGLTPELEKRSERKEKISQ